MELKIIKRVAEEIGLQRFKEYGINKDSWTWKEIAFLDLRRLGKEKTETLRAMLEQNRRVRGVGTLIKDCDTWIAALADPSGQKVRTIRHFAPLLKKIMQPLPHKHLFKKADEYGDAWLAYYINKVEYHPKVVSRDGVKPASVTMEYVWEEFGGLKEKREYFYDEDVRGRNVNEILARFGFYCETPEHRKKYEAEATRFSVIVKEIGKQYLAIGWGKDDLDGNPTGRDRSWYWNQVNTHELLRDGSPSRVVIDVFKEDNTRSDRESRIYLDTWFWKRDILIPPDAAVGKVKDEDDEEIEENIDPDDLDDSEEPQEIEVPIHPLTAVFDLKKHLRLRVHVNYLTEYKYDHAIAEKLILPMESKELVHLLIEHQEGEFNDIVAGKSGGAVVLLCGAPGTGKTLTAEVYAESEGKALYSVQASQLGTDPTELEDELLKVLTRAKRWGAVMLIDEADVYVHERGRDLQQNAIVGVFLRVLEYHSSILFLTTNRPDDVDDAIASRCVARINYAVPTTENQKKIWNVLAAASKITLPAKVVDEIVRRNPRLSGRDVKNLLKLSRLISRGGNKEITPETVEFAKKFKPTCDGDAEAANA